VLLCRGCCCGTSAKHPGVDHLAQEQALDAAVADRPDVELRIVDCLDECDRNNVVVVRRHGRPARERDTWFGGVVTGKASRALVEWVEDGAPEPAPAPLAGLRFRHVVPHRAKK
jgi:(2Fe-2S) ferredoxin